MGIFSSPSSPKNHGPIARLQALPESTRRGIATIVIAVLMIIIIVVWLAIPETPKNAQKDDWRSLIAGLETTWQSSQKKFGEITNSVSQIRNVFSSPDASNDLKQAFVQEHTKDWAIYHDPAQQFSFKYPADTILATSTNPVSIRIHSIEATPWLQFTVLPTSSPLIASSTKTWHLVSAIVSVTDFIQSATTTLIIETFSVTPEKL